MSEEKTFKNPIRDGTLKISISQVNNADAKKDGCMRKWFLKSVVKLKEPKSKATTFGSVLHEVAERFLLADDLGLDETGEPVNLYPEGWTQETNRWTNKKDGEHLTLKEQRNVEFLIQDAIESGMLSRMPGREIEKEFDIIALEHEGVKVKIGGFIDLYEPGAIRDHKTSSNPRYMKTVNPMSKNSLQKDNQMMWYAYASYELDFEPKDQNVWLEHKYYIVDKTKNGALRTESRLAEVNYADCDRHFKERIKPVIEEMVETLLTAKSHKEVPVNVHACRAFGGCKFQQVCSGACTPEQHNARFEKAKETTSQNKSEDTKMAMTLKERIEAQKAAKANKGAAVATAAPASTPTVAPVKPKPVEPKAEVAPVSAPEATTGKPLAPWAADGCTMCAKDIPVGGFAANFGICPLCRTKAKAQGKQGPEDFQIFTDDPEVILICTKAGEEVLSHIVAQPEVTHKDKATSKAEEEPVPAPAPAPAVEEAPVEPTPAMVEEPVPAPVVEEAPAEAPVEMQEALAAPLETTQIKSTKAPMTFVAEDSDVQLDITSCRGKGTLLLNCGVLEGHRNGNKVGSPAFTMSGVEFLEAVKKIFVEEARKAGSQIEFFEEADKWMRTDWITANASKLASLVGSSTIQVLTIRKGSDMDTLIEAIKPYMGKVIVSLAVS